MAERAKLNGRKSRSNGGVGHNSVIAAPDEVYQRWMKKIEVAQAAVERANKPLKSRKSELSAIYKAAKADGVDVDAIREAFKLHEEDHLDVVARYTNTGRVLRLMASPLGQQMELFATTTIPLAVQAAAAGKRAGSLGHAKNNPHAPGSEPFVAFDEAYDAAQAKLQDDLRDQ